MLGQLPPDDQDGGLRRVIGAWGLGAAIFNTVVGAGIFILPAALAQEAGARAPWAYLGCTVIMGCVAVCFAAAGSRTPTSGGPYGYVEAAFGPFAGFMVGLMVWLGSVLAAAGITAGIADAVATAAPVLGGGAARLAMIALVLGGLAAINLAGAALGARLVAGLTVVKLLPLLLLLAAGALAGGAAPAAPLASSGGANLGSAMLLAIFAFQGMETALGVSGEVRSPARNVPRALLGAMAAVSVLYIALQLTAQRLLGAALAHSAAPLAAAGAAAWRPLGPVLLVGSVVSMLGYLASDVLSAPRTLFAFGRAGLLPGVFARTSARSGAPTAAILAHAGLAALLASTGSFVQLATLAALAIVGVYILGCWAAVVLQGRGVAQAGAPLAVPGLLILALVGSAGMIWLAVNAKPAELAGLGATLVAGALVYALTLKSRRRARLA